MQTHNSQVSKKLVCFEFRSVFSLAFIYKGDEYDTVSVPMTFWNISWMCADEIHSVIISGLTNMRHVSSKFTSSHLQFTLLGIKQLDLLWCWEAQTRD